MNRAALEAAFRLSTQLPSTVHRRPERREAEQDREESTPKNYRSLPRNGANHTHAIRTLPGGQKVKYCSGCKADHPLDAFNQGMGPGGLRRHCREYEKQWREARK